MQPDSIILALARHVLALAGARLVSHGYMGAGDVEQFAGAILVLGALVWSVVNKFKVGKAIYINRNQAEAALALAQANLVTNPTSASAHIATALQITTQGLADRDKS